MLPSTHPLAGLSAYARRQVVVMDMLSGVKVGEKTAASTVVVSGQRGAPEALVPAPLAAAAAELGVVESLNRQRLERAPEIHAQLAFNPGFWAGIVPLSSRSTPFTLELMAALVMWSSFIVQQVKTRYNLPRPVDLSPRIHPMIETPGFSTYPSGHATQAALVSTLLRALAVPGLAADWRAPVESQLIELARRIAENREVAGVHFPSDSRAGLALGEGLLGLLVKPAPTPLLAPPPPPQPYKKAAAAAAPKAEAGVAVGLAAARREGPFAWLWQQAAKEWSA